MARVRDPEVYLNVARSARITGHPYRASKTKLFNVSQIFVWADSRDSLHAPDHSQLNRNRFRIVPCRHCLLCRQWQPPSSCRAAASFQNRRRLPCCSGAPGDALCLRLGQPAQKQQCHHAGRLYNLLSQIASSVLSSILHHHSFKSVTIPHHPLRISSMRMPSGLLTSASSVQALFSVLCYT